MRNHFESDGSIYFGIVTEIKKLEPIFMNFDPKPDSSTRYYDVIDKIFFKKFSKLLKLAISSRKLQNITSHKCITLKNFEISRFSILPQDIMTS